MGFIFKVFSRTQSVVALSSAESEILGLTEAVKEAVHLRTLFAECGLSLGIVAFCDSSSCIAATLRRGLGSRLKHLDLRLTYCQDMVRDGVLQLRYVNSDDNTADVLTKALGQAAHQQHTRALGVMTEAEAREL
jgi:hypothetical protein